MTDGQSITPPARGPRHRRAYADNAASVFTWKRSSLDEVIAADTALVALDTNTLLLPYTIDKLDITVTVEDVYQRLANENRLIVPGQVAREFANNRVSLIGRIIEQVERKVNEAKLPRPDNYPLVALRDLHHKVIEAWKSANKYTQEYKAALQELQRDVENLSTEDPVVAMYGKVFSESVVIDPAFDADKLDKEWAQRLLEKTPPGYRDDKKDDGGIGDYLVWSTLLHAARERGLDLVMVTNETKDDWWHLGNKGGKKIPLHPRHELIDEYRQVSGGGSLHLIAPSQFLALFTQAADSVIDAVRWSEQSTSEAHQPWRGLIRAAHGDITSPHFDEQNARLVKDGQFVLIRGLSGLAAIRPSKQYVESWEENGVFYSKDHLEYEAWFAPDVSAFENGLGSADVHKTFTDTSPLKVGEFEVNWSGSGDGAGWIYYFRGDGGDPYELAVAEGPVISDFDFVVSDFKVERRKEKA